MEWNAKNLGLKVLDADPEEDGVEKDFPALGICDVMAVSGVYASKVIS